MLYWHFCRNDRKLSHGDGRRIRPGRTLKVTGKPVLWGNGLHAARRICTALDYASGDIACRVKLGGKIVHGRGCGLTVATERQVLSMADATKVLFEFACICSERALKKAGVKDKRYWNAIAVKRRRLIGQATRKELTTVRNVINTLTAHDEYRVDTVADDAREAVARTLKETGANWAAREAARASWIAREADRVTFRGKEAACEVEKKWQEDLLTKMVLREMKGGGAK